MNMETVYTALQNATGCAVRGDGADWPLPWVSFQEKTRNGQAQLLLEVCSLSREHCDSLSFAAQNALYTLGYGLQNASDRENWQSATFIRNMVFQKLLTTSLKINGRTVGGLYALSVRHLPYSALDESSVRSLQGGPLKLTLTFVSDPGDLGQQEALTGGEMELNNKPYLAAIEEIKAKGQLITCHYTLEEKETQ